MARPSAEPTSCVASLFWRCDETGEVFAPVILLPEVASQPGRSTDTAALATLQ